MFLFRGFGEVHISILVGTDLSKTYTYARSLLMHFTELDSRYRQYAATDIYAEEKLIRSTLPFSKRQLADQLKLSWFQLLDPCSHGATIWYSAGRLLGEMKVAVVLDTQRRYRDTRVG
jgi:hypothetical protein